MFETGKMVQHSRENKHLESEKFTAVGNFTGNKAAISQI